MPAEQPPEKVTITLDGRPVEANKGEMIITAAERAGVYIPRFCYHPRMAPVGMCRMCLIDLKGPRGYALTPACFFAVADGQEVVTDSPAVKKAQDGVLEFLLVNHPLDCPVCDKGGECPLQDQTLAFGPGESRFVEEKRHWAKPIALSGLVLLDRERCIQCARCTRFADEVAGDPLIDFAMRGDQIEVATFPDEPFSSYFSGNTVQICPVGALTSVPYRFKGRPWDLEQVESSCASCAVGCRVAIQSSGDVITRYLGVDSDPINQGWLCDKGRYDFEAVISAERLTAPMVRKGGELVEASWSEALDAAAKGLNDAKSLHGGRSVGLLGGARLANEDAYTWSKLARTVLETDSVDAQLGDGLPARTILGLPRATIDQACRAAAVILLGPDLKEELPVLYLRLRHAAVEDKLPIIELSPQRTGLSRYAGATLQFRPGEAVLLARALVAAQAPDGDVAGVSAAEINAARQLLAGARESSGRLADVVVVLGRPSLADSGDGVAAAASLLAGAGGVSFLSALRRSNIHGALDMGLAPGVLPGRVSLEAARHWYQDAWGVLPEEEGLDATGMLVGASQGQVAALVLLGADPLADYPDRTLADRGLDAAGFVVAVDCFLTESVARADVVLPAATYAERPGTFTNLEGRVLRLGQKITPPGGAWPDWMIAVELALRLGGDLGLDNLDAVWDEIERLSPAHRGTTRELLSSRAAKDGVVLPLGGATRPPVAPSPIDPMADPGIASAETHGVPVTAISPHRAASGVEAGRGAEAVPAASDTGSGAAPDDPSLAADVEAIVAAAPAPVGTLLADAPPLLRFEGAGDLAAVPPLDSYSLRLISGRSLWDAGTLVGHAPHLAGLAPAPALRANHYDLDRLGVVSGGQVRVVSPRTSMVIDVVADPGVPRGSASLVFNLAGVRAADLIDATAPVTDVRLESV